MAKTEQKPEAHKVHLHAELFPLLDEAGLGALATDIKGRGLLEPILLHPDGRILDGRNRLEACRRAGVEPRFATYEGADEAVLDRVLSLNLHRRHLTEGQRAMIAARLATLGKGRPSGRENAGIQAFSQGEAAGRLNVSRDSVQKARKVLEEGTPELVAKVDRGEVRLAEAAAATRRRERDAGQDDPR